MTTKTHKQLQKKKIKITTILTKRIEKSQDVYGINRNYKASKVRSKTKW